MSRRDRAIKNLIAAENAETRGRIKELQDLLELPARLQQELRSITSELPAGLADTVNYP